MDDPIVLRKIERKGFCRGCDKVLLKDTPILYTYSWRNRGQSIIFCIPCAESIGELLGCSKDEQ